MDEFHRHARALSHPAVAPPDHRHDHWIEVKSFFGEPILESMGVLFVLNSAQNSVAHQLTQAVRQAMRREPQILLNRVKPADAQEEVADDQHCPAVADHRQGSCDRAGHRVNLLPAHLS